MRQQTSSFAVQQRLDDSLDINVVEVFQIAHTAVYLGSGLVKASGELRVRECCRNLEHLALEWLRIRRRCHRRISAGYRRNYLVERRTVPRVCERDS